VYKFIALATFSPENLPLQNNSVKGQSVPAAESTISIICALPCAELITISPDASGRSHNAAATSEAVKLKVSALPSS